ncbi:MAG: hypothetical protein LWW94_10915 [Candidatus Desulfofervidaceae bacterium]|nr:hypothetical protein [Candidatus Desulfofervidaceae bacterium]
MQLLDILKVTKNYSYRWPGGDVERYEIAITYKAVSNDGEHEITIAYTKRNTYGKDRRRVVWIDGYPYAEFLAADDFYVTDEVLSEIKFYDEENESIRMCRYAEDAIPQRYSMFKVDSLRRRVNGAGVHNAWAVVSNIADHLTMSYLASMRKYEMKKKDKS